MSIVLTMLLVKITDQSRTQNYLLSILQSYLIKELPNSSTFLFRIYLFIYYVMRVKCMMMDILLKMHIVYPLGLLLILKLLFKRLQCI